MTEAHPFRFAASLPGMGTDFAAWQQAVRRIEVLGYGLASISDHFIGGWSMDVFVTMTAALLATTRLRVTSLVLANDYRHPALVHRAVAGLDRASGGRVELGIGTGWWPDEYAALGVGLDPPEVRVERLAESIGIIKALFGGEPVELSGRHYSIQGLRGLPPPTQQPRPTILIGGGSASILALAGREADIAGIYPPRARDGVIHPEALTSDRTGRRVAQVRDAARSAGRPDGSVRFQLSVLAWDLGEAAGGAANGHASVADPGLVQAARGKDLTGVLIGSVEEVCARLQDWRTRYGFSEIHVGSNAEAFAPIVSRLAGR